MSATGQWLIELLERGQAGDQAARRLLIENGYGSAVAKCCEAAIEYRQRFNWAVIPQRPGTKKPCVRWKAYKDELRQPTVEQIYEWYDRWPDAGVIGLLGPVSGLFAIDVDGEEAHSVLVQRLGGVPKAPSSWRRKKFRYHLLFRHPKGIATNAKFTPWHPQLEFRGHGGYVVLPPSQHESGQSYRWKRNRSPRELRLPGLPKSILKVLKEKADRRRKTHPPRPCSLGAQEELPPVNVIPGLANATRVFLSGRFANETGWNDRLFRAACDMAGNHVDEDMATRMLLTAARPWDEEDHHAALATIKSAYSSQRAPARTYHPVKTVRPQGGEDNQISHRTVIKVEP